MLRPGMSRASTMVKPVVSKLKRTAAIWPAGMVERIVRACSMPGNDRSSMYFAAPDVFDAPSLRRTLRPTAGVARGIAAIIRRGSGGLLEALADHRGDAGFVGRQRTAVHVSGEDGRMNVGLAADRLRISETRRHAGDRRHHVALGFGLRLEAREPGQRLRGEHRAGPRAEVLGGEVVAADLAQIPVHVVGADRLALAVVVDVLEQFVAGEIAAGLDDLREARVVELDGVRDAALAAEFEAHLAAADLGVPIAHRRQSDRAVGAGVLFVADANQRLLEELHRGGEDLLARQPLLPHVSRSAPADLAERLGERRQAAVLHVVTHLAELGVIPVLLT